jgi:hypothetical protein
LRHQPPDIFAWVLKTFRALHVHAALRSSIRFCYLLAAPSLSPLDSDQPGLSSIIGIEGKLPESRLSEDDP